MRLPLHKRITTHSQYWHSGMCCYFYSLSIIEFTYCMYILVNKDTFIVEETIKAIIKKSINLINTTSLSDNQSYLVQWQHISTTMFISYVNYYTTFFSRLQANIQNFYKFLFIINSVTFLKKLYLFVLSFTFIILYVKIFFICIFIEMLSITNIKC